MLLIDGLVTEAMLCVAPLSKTGMKARLPALLCVPPGIVNVVVLALLTPVVIRPNGLFGSTFLNVKILAWFRVAVPNVSDGMGIRPLLASRTDLVTRRQYTDMPRWIVPEKALSVLDANNRSE